MFLIDTDWLLNALHDRGAALDVLEALSDRDLAISVVSLGEIYAGIVGEVDEEGALAGVERFIALYDVLDVTSSIVLTFSRLKNGLQRKGTSLADFDLLIAATAITTERVLITRNKRHFDRVPGLRIY